MCKEVDNAPWYVVHSRPRRELMVASLLGEYETTNVFLPEVWQHRKQGKRLVPLFPGYLFAQIDLERYPTSIIRRTPGVIKLVSHDYQPQLVADAVVRSLQERVSQLNNQGGLLPHTFSEGDRVLFNEGPFQGLEAVFAGPMHPSERVQVLLHFLGQEQKIEVEVGSIEKVPPPTGRAKRARRTRGRGRKIKQS